MSIPWVLDNKMSQCLYYESQKLNNSKREERKKNIRRKKPLEIYITGIKKHRLQKYWNPKYRYTNNRHTENKLQKTDIRTAEKLKKNWQICRFTNYMITEVQVNIWVKLLRMKENRHKGHIYFYFVPKIHQFCNLNQGGLKFSQFKKSCNWLNSRPPS